MSTNNRGNGFFRYDGSFYAYCSKLFDVLMLDFLWLIGCLPVVTVGASCSALYGCMVNCICRDEKSAAAEFWRIYKRDLKKSIPLWVFYAVAIGVLLLNLGIVTKQGTEGFWLFLTVVYAILIAVLIVSGTFLFALLCRFEMPMGWYIRVAIWCSIRYLHIALLLLALWAVAYLTVLYCIPLALVAPAVYCLASQFFVNPILEKMQKTNQTESEEGSCGE